MIHYLWTLDGGRLHYQSSHAHGNLNWIFVPGGPGLGSEALNDLTKLLKAEIPGTIWHFDFPNDGSNILDDKSIFNWRSSLIQAISAFEKVVLVAHSTPGMYVQTMPELEGMLEGLVLIGSAPDARSQQSFDVYCQNNTDIHIKNAEEKYIKNPTDETLRTLLISAANYCFVSEQSLAKGIELFKRIPVNHSANALSSKIFDTENYQASWIPEKVATLIMAGDKDIITPLDLFKDELNYQKKNVILKRISEAGHYPWIENPIEVRDSFKEFSKKFPKAI